MEKLIQTLELIGCSETDLALLQSETATEENVKTIVEGLKSKQKTLIENDKDFLASIIKPAEAKIKGSVESFIKRTLGLTAEEVKDMKLEDMIVFGKSKLEKELAKNPQEIQDELLRVKQRNEELEAQIPELETKFKTEAQSEIKRFKITEKLNEHLDKLYDSGNGVLLGKPTAIKNVIEPFLFNNFNVDYDDSGISLLTKDNLKVTNKDKTSVITPDEVIKNYLDESGFIKKSNANTETQQKKVVVIDKDKVESPGVKAARANLERLNAEKENK